MGQNETGGTSLLNGRLVIAVRVPGWYRYAISPAPEIADTYVEVSVHTEVCNPGDEFGLMLRVSPEDDHYRFTLTCDGSARISRVIGGSLVGLIPITPTTDVIPGAPADNRIAVWASGNTFHFYINGIDAFTVRDATLPSGGLGLIVRSRAAGQVTVAFDDLLARALPPTPSRTATPATQP